LAKGFTLQGEGTTKKKNLSQRTPSQRDRPLSVPTKKSGNKFGKEEGGKFAHLKFEREREEKKG